MVDRNRDGRSEFTPQADEIRAMAAQDVAVARERLVEGTVRIKNYVATEPARALGIALGVGVLLGWMIARR